MYPTLSGTFFVARMSAVFRGHFQALYLFYSLITSILKNRFTCYFLITDSAQIVRR